MLCEAAVVLVMCVFPCCGLTSYLHTYCYRLLLHASLCVVLLFACACQHLVACCVCAVQYAQHCACRTCCRCCEPTALWLIKRGGGCVSCLRFDLLLCKKPAQRGGLLVLHAPWLGGVVSRWPGWAVKPNCVCFVAWHWSAVTHAACKAMECCNPCACNVRLSLCSCQLCCESCILRSRGLCVCELNRQSVVCYKCRVQLGHGLHCVAFDSSVCDISLLPLFD